jgi:predicted transcriptional regulator
MDMDDLSLGERELDVMGVLWNAGSATVGEVRDRLAAALAYTTVLTILRNLEGKGLVRHEEEGRAHRYFPLVARETARRSALGRIVGKLFGGDPSALVAHMVDDRVISADDLQALQRRLDARRPTAPPAAGGATNAGRAPDDESHDATDDEGGAR